MLKTKKNPVHLSPAASYSHEHSGHSSKLSRGANHVLQPLYVGRRWREKVVARTATAKCVLQLIYSTERCSSDLFNAPTAQDRLSPRFHNFYQNASSSAPRSIMTGCAIESSSSSSSAGFMDTAAACAPTTATGCDDLSKYLHTQPHPQPRVQFGSPGGGFVDSTCLPPASGGGGVDQTQLQYNNQELMNNRSNAVSCQKSKYFGLFIDFLLVFSTFPPVLVISGLSRRVRNHVLFGRSGLRDRSQ
jgi:hypothetical protein